MGKIKSGYIFHSTLADKEPIGEHISRLRFFVCLFFFVFFFLLFALGRNVPEPTLFFLAQAMIYG